MSGHHSTSHFRGGQNTMRHHGFPGDQQHIHSHDSSSNEQLAFFSIHKPLNASSWDDATPVHHRLSTSDIRKALAKLHQNPRNTVKNTLMNLRSDSARRLINGLVQEQNEKESDSTIEWLIAGIDVQKEIVKQWPSQKKVIKSIEVILKTESTHDFNDDPFGSLPLRGPFEGSGAQMIQPHRNLNEHVPGMGHAQPQVMHQQPPMGAQPMQVNGRERGEIMHGRQDMPPPPPPHHVQGGHHAQQPHGMLPGAQPVGGGVGIPPPPPPPPPHGGPFKHPQVMQPPFDPQQQPIPMAGSFSEARPAPQFIPQPEFFYPRVLKHQKSKPKNPSPEFQDPPMVYVVESDSDSSSSEIGSQFSSRSVEDGYGFVARSRSRSRDGSQSRGRERDGGRSRSNGRDRMPRIVKVKKSHGRSRPDVELNHGGKHSPSSKSSSPPSSASALPTQQIFNIRIDNDNDRERERKNDRGRDADAGDHDGRRGSKSTPPPGFTNDLYSKRDKIDVHPVSRHSFVGGSDTGSSVMDGNSSIYTSDDSVFSEPMRPRMHSRTTSEVGGGLHLRSRNMPTPRHNASKQESHRRQKQHYEADDYPHRPKGSLYDDYVDPHHTPSFRQPPMAPRRHSVRLSNPFDQRYPAQPSRSYTQYPTQPFRQQYIADSRPEPFDFRTMTDELGAMNYVNRPRRNRLPHRRNSPRGRVSPEVDEWAYRPQGRIHDAYRHMY
ncbi:hypothetical protein PMIN01_04535 [Paraphaeosphaeria minitans]|uniref:Uncharacterized protein n=1 Tax=Paraphaeosphaeria minitans TaxID=565426 RepID=A0A9P6GKB0_9PLEO|nr:hypothetical protein PMIN01_04535 [Paraphaeosphaeria minitans]